MFAPDGRWEAGDSLKILSRGAGTFSTPGEPIPGFLRNRHFCIFWPDRFRRTARFDMGRSPQIQSLENSGPPLELCSMALYMDIFWKLNLLN